MSVMIKNITNKPVFLRLNSGQTLHLAPRMTSTEIMDVEVNKNPKIQKLQNRHIIALHDVKKKLSQTTRVPKKEKTEEAKKANK